MTPSRPYLLRALYEWMVDNDTTPHMLVLVDSEQVRVPMEFVNDGRIVLNVAPQAVQQLDISDEWVQFQARFGGVAQMVSFPVAKVEAIYARENGQGMAFSSEEYEGITVEESGADSDEDPDPNKPGKGSHLKVVK